MLIDAAHPEETRVAVVRGNRVEEFDFESEHKTQLRGNIYLAKVTRVEPSLQAAFVDYGGNRHGFLAFSEIHPDYYQIPLADRQALLEAEAADARAAAQEDDDEAVIDSEAETDAEDDESSEEPEAEKKAKPARKPRARRRKKSDDSEENPDKPAEIEAAETDTAVEDSSDKDVESTPESENSDSSDSDGDDDGDPKVMAAENENDDVVSEPASAADEKAAKKPARRRTSRKKKEPEEEAPEAVSEAAVSEAAATDAPDEAAADEKPKKKTRRRTSRKKKDTEVESEAEAEVEAETKDAEPVAAKANEDAGEDSSDEPAADEKPKRKRARRSRRKKPADAVADNEDDNENGGSAVEELGSDDALEEVPTRRANRRHYKIQEVIKRRQILLVQVAKEERGNKGAALTTYLSLAGRYSVLMPNTARGGGISRKITNAADRKRLKSIATGLDVPEGMGVILRTAGASRTNAEIQRDFEYLMRLWENVRTLTLESTAPCLTYEEGSLIKRSIRDLYDKDTGEILVAGEDGYREAKDFVTMLMPSHARNVKLYKDRIPLFAKMGVEAQLDAMLQPQVTLKSGGYLVINQTEALVAIDVNSGRSTRQHSIEDTATQTNLEAADEVARQLRLRDLAGLIVIDFIDMEDRRNNRAVEKRLKDALKNDRARIQVGRISHFGLMEMSRQRIRASVLESTTQACPTCDGLGHVRSASSIALHVLRAIEEQLNKNSRNDLTVRVRTEIALYLLNNKREHISDLETRFGVAIAIATDPTLGMTPCAIDKGEVSRKRAPQESFVKPDTIEPVVDNVPSESVEDQATDDNAQPENDEESSGGGRKRRRRRRRRGGKSEGDGESAQQTAEADGSVGEPDTAEVAADTEAKTETEAEAEEPKPARRARRSKKPAEDAPKPSPAAEAAEEQVGSDPEEAPEPKRRTSRPRKKKPVSEDAAALDNVAASTAAETVSAPVVENAGPEDASSAKPAPRPKRRTTRRKPDVGTEPAEAAVATLTGTEATPEAEPEAGSDDKSKKSGWWQRKFF